MALNLSNNSTIEGFNQAQAFKINTGSYDNLNIDIYGNPSKVAIGFIAGHSGGDAWVQQNVSPYKYTNFNATIYNYNNCFSTANSRFTAPQSGHYIFTASQYNYKPSGSETDYHHPMFFVNGGGSTKRGGGEYVKYRMRGRNVVVGYAFDSQISEVIYLDIGDYVEFWSHTITTVHFYRTYSHFAGFLVG
jgi:hypothetical protein